MIIEEFDIYQQLTTQLQTKVVAQMFTNYIGKFNLFFAELEVGFVNEVVVNLFARTLKPGEVIYEPGHVVDQLVFITRGNITICEPSDYYEPFLILREGSFYGDFQIFRKVPCLYRVKAFSDSDFEVQN